MITEAMAPVLGSSMIVPARKIDFNQPIYSQWEWRADVDSKRTVYDTSFIGTHSDSIQEPKNLSCNPDLDPETVARSKSNPLARIISILTGLRAH